MAELLSCLLLDDYSGRGTTFSQVDDASGGSLAAGSTTGT